MFIHEKIYEKTVEIAKTLTITDVRIGLGYTIVELESRHWGVSYSFMRELNPATCTALEDAGSLTGKSADHLIKKIFSYNLLDATLAIATANAILNRPETAKEDADVIDLIQPDDTVVMIGYFSPLVPLIEKKAKKLTICERAPRGNSMPDYAAYFELRNCTVALLSATTVINKTVDALLEASRARVTALLGPSTIMDKEIFENTGLTHLCGSYVTDGKAAKRIISEGGGTRKLKPATQKGCLCVSAG